MSPAALLRVLVVAALASVTAHGAPAATAAPSATTAATAATASTTTFTDTPALDRAMTSRALAAANAVRAGAGIESLYPRSGYNTTAQSMATALVERKPVALPADGAPAVYAGGIAPLNGYEFVVDQTIGNLVTTLDAALTYELHTDVGVAVVVRAWGPYNVRYGVALVAGWPAPPVATDAGCVNASGYCWSARGLNPHLPWTRNQVKVYLSTSRLPAAGESLLKTAIATLNKVSGFGADVVYGGRTADTAPTTAHRFVVVWGSGCDSTSLACTTTTTQGTGHFVFQARTAVAPSRYAANPNTALWVGTLMHEVAHAVGLGHFNGTYGGRYQLMRWANGPNTVQSGDANGLRRVDPAGALAVSVSGVRNGAAYSLVVRTTNSGLGGLRAVRTDCLDAAGVWRTVGRVDGVFDGRTADRTVGSADPGRTCRAVARSKARLVISAAVRLPL
jgi:hypothetical protein